MDLCEGAIDEVMQVMDVITAGVNYRFDQFKRGCLPIRNPCSGINVRVVPDRSTMSKILESESRMDLTKR